MCGLNIKLFAIVFDSKMFFRKSFNFIQITTNVVYIIYISYIHEESSGDSSDDSIQEDETGCGGNLFEVTLFPSCMVFRKVYSLKA